MNPDQLVEWQRYMEKSYAELSTRLGEVEKGFAVFQAVAKEQQNFIQDRLNRVQDNINQTKKDLTEEIAPVRSGISKFCIVFHLEYRHHLRIVQYDQHQFYQ